MEENKRVLLGMSGGTDSSVAAMRLLEAGYEVIGVTFRFYELNGSTEYLEDARNLAERLGIRHITYDAREIFNKQIIDYFVQEYLAGRTPVPCTLCNNYLKWPLLDINSYIVCKRNVDRRARIPLKCHSICNLLFCTFIIQC